jgi:hypothetical protein
MLLHLLVILKIEDYGIRYKSYKGNVLEAVYNNTSETSGIVLHTNIKKVKNLCRCT